MGARPNRQILAIDLLRCLCALAVAVFHFTTVFPLALSSPVQRYSGAPALPAGLAGWTWFGWVGVEIFFVISGYVIARSAVGTDRVTFLRRRALRLAPAAWICASITAAAAVAAGAMPIGAAFGRWSASVAFWPIADQIDPCYWTLGVETLFYLLVTAVIGRQAGIDGRRIERLGEMLSAASLCYWLAVSTGILSISLRTEIWLGLTLLPDGAFFAIGIALASLARDGATVARVRAALLPLVPAICEIADHTHRLSDIPGFTANLFVPVLVFALALALIAAAERLQGALSATFGASLLPAAGLATYPLYLLNQEFGAAMVGAALRWVREPALAMAVAFALVLAIAVTISRAIEPRLRGWLAASFRAAPTAQRDPSPDIPGSAFPQIG